MKLNQKCPEMMALLQCLGDSVFFKDQDGRFVIVSDAKACRSGVLWSEMIGKTDFDFLPFEEAQKCRNDDEYIMKTGESIVGKEEKLTRSDGMVSWVSVSKSLWRDPETEEILGIIGISRDISEKKKMENHILQMLAIATHDMRSPIVSIAFIVKLLMRGRYGEIGESARQTLQDVFSRLVKVEKIIGEYLAKSSIMSSSKIARKATLDLRQDIIDPILEDLSGEIDEKNIRIDNRLGAIPGNRVLVSANKNWLEIVYKNLFTNAIKHTPIGGMIAYGFEDVGSMYRLNVFNSGLSVDSVKKEMIFEMFESEKSSGIGLPVIRELIRRHQGDLWCEDSLDGQHPNFVFTLPKE
jgi:PAS domain S-box-containing protein